MSRVETIAEGIEMYPGECMDTLATMDESSVDSCVTDPPYHLTSIVKRWGGAAAERENAAKADGANNPRNRLSRGFMGKVWDGGEIAFEPETWAAVYRVLKPGGHLCAFGAPKNFGFMQYAISQAGFEIRDVLAWIFGSGFPKSHNLPGGFGTALKPAYEPIILARKPLSEGTVAANVQEHGTGALNIDGCRVGTDGGCAGAGAGAYIYGDGLNGTFAKPVPGLGRWPANVIHDGSEEVVGAFPAETVRSGSDPNGGAFGANGIYGEAAGAPTLSYRDTGSASRFFYSAKADADDRLGSKHPTVKPLDLMQYLVRLVTPRGGLCLDPFAGTGTTGEACIREGMRAVLIEREPEYQDDIRRRMKLAMSGPDERARESIKAKMKDVPPDHGPLFADIWKEPFYKDEVG